MYKQRNRLTRDFIKFNSLLDDATGCWNWKRYIQSSGYGQFSYGNKMLLAHRASYLIFKDIDHDEIFDLNPIHGMLICHRCDNHLCVNPEHLFEGTQQDNVDDCWLKERNNKDFSFTRKNRVRKLSDENVQSIYGSRESLRYLSDKYGVSKGNISLIRNGKRKQTVTQCADNLEFRLSDGQDPPTPHGNGVAGG